MMVQSMFICVSTIHCNTTKASIVCLRTWYRLGLSDLTKVLKYISIINNGLRNHKQIIVPSSIPEFSTLLSILKKIIQKNHTDRNPAKQTGDDTRITIVKRRQAISIM